MESTKSAADTLWTVEFTFHSAKSVPVADFPVSDNNPWRVYSPRVRSILCCRSETNLSSHPALALFKGFSADPFLACFLAVPAHPLHNDDNPLEFRTPTIRANLNPTWESKWRVAGIPSSGFKLTIRLRDEDPGDHDDRLGTVTVREHSVGADLFRDHQEYNVMKRRGSIRAYVMTYLASAVVKNISIHARLYMSIKVIGKTPNQEDRRVYTVGPRTFPYLPAAATRGTNKSES